MTQSDSPHPHGPTPCGLDMVVPSVFLSRRNTYNQDENDHHVGSDLSEPQRVQWAYTLFSMLPSPAPRVSTAAGNAKNETERVGAQLKPTLCLSSRASRSLPEPIPQPGSTG